MPDSALDAALQSIWFRPDPPPLPLRALSCLFGLGVRARRAAYTRGWLRTRRLAQPVIVVGNLTVGGSGKTPLVIWLTERLRAAGRAPGIVLRGYGGSAASAGAPRRVEPDSDPAVVGDEALLLRLRTALPVAIGRDRVRAAQLLLDEGADVIVADDGLQHLAMARDFEIAVIDGERGFGNGYLLPAGPMREPRSQLTRMDAVVINGAGRFERQAPAVAGAAFHMRLAGEQLHALDDPGGSLPLSSLAGQRAHALAGIGHPQRFFAQLRAAGVEIIEHAFPDHHRYRAEELAFGDALPLLMTEKDAVKCRRFAGANRWFLPVVAEFPEGQAAALLDRLGRSLTSPVH